MNILPPLIVSDSYTCPTCGQGVFTTMGPHHCPGYWNRQAPAFHYSTTTTSWPVPRAPRPAIKPKVRD